MPTDPTFTPGPTRRLRARRRAAATSPPPPTTETLIAATFDAATEVLSMTFDRAVAIDDYGGTSTLVDAPAAHALLLADDTPRLSADGRTVAANCEAIEASSGATTWLSVPAGSGIVDAATGEAWAGCEQLALPFAA